jgi:hypothetical protein
MDPWTEFITGLRVTEVGASGLLVIVVLMILTGRLVPKSVADGWRNAYLKSEEASRVKDETINELVGANRVSMRVLDALPPAKGGEPDVEETTETRRRRRQG